jgi:hypothetical protein
MPEFLLDLKHRLPDLIVKIILFVFFATILHFRHLQLVVLSDKVEQIIFQAIKVSTGTRYDLSEVVVDIGLVTDAEVYRLNALEL